MKKRFFLPILLVLSLFASCSGMIEQPGFVSIFSGHDGSITLKNIAQSQNNEITLGFEGLVKNIQVYALRENAIEEIACTVQELNTEENTTIKAAASANDEISIFKITPLSSFGIGEAFKICGKVKAGLNEVLDFELPFKGSNNNPAELSFSSLKVGSASKPGFIKFSVKKSGNLFGINLVNAGNSKEPDYVFPAFEVKEGNTIVFYWFLPLDGSEPEDGVLVSAADCDALVQGEKAFCFWGKLQKFQPKKTNAIIIKTGQDGTLQDAVLFRNPNDETWGKEEVEQAALEAAEAGLWNPDGDILNAVQVKMTPTKLIKRISQETINHDAGDWVLPK
ncbi:hypothetical protein [Treponema putidum]|uniref:TP-1001-like C-terminal domain-containing protein n=1 Tax=Treponema putidum TaxID=221027 RepID=A0AAE9MSY9_9SPIR|nr:hypothetical protein [Treponema putidum]UTY29559.1 hypothetical protein E4N76_11735 [Treponema putidum]UTY32042.1 hypothetical protein E4N75_11570 [Treponema putidum]UTY34420.1 hypothetical protein E4N74_10720 [Treponema putidum]